MTWLFWATPYVASDHKDGKRMTDNDNSRNEGHLVPEGFEITPIPEDPENLVMVACVECRTLVDPWYVEEHKQWHRNWKAMLVQEEENGGTES